MTRTDAIRAILAAWLCLVPALAEGRGLERRLPPGATSGRIEYPGGSSPSFDRFLSQLDTLVSFGSNEVRIVHVGGSHIQGGMWSGRLRKDLMSMRYGMDGGRGMVFPYSAAGTNTPVGYRSSYSGEWTWTRCLKPDSAHPLGLSGMSVSTSDPTAFLCIDLATRDERDWTPGFTFKSIDIIGYGSGGARPVVVMDSDTLSGRRISEQQVWRFELPYYTDFVKVVPKGLPGELTILGLVLDKPMIGLTYSEIGVNGASTISYLQCDGFERDMALLKPNLVIFSIGINDIQGKEFEAARFISRYEKLMEMAERASPGCAFLFTTNNDSYRKGSPNPFTDECTKAFRTLASRHKAALFDLYKAMGGNGSIVNWEEAGLARNDRIHFTREGYELIADMMFEALKQELSNRRKRK